MALSGANIIDNVYNDRALLVEPELRLKAIYEEHLELSGFEVHSTTNLAQAANVLEYVPVNLIVCNENAEAAGQVLSFTQNLRQQGIQNSVILLTDNEEQVWEHLPEDEMAFQTFPIPHDLEHFFKTDINQFVSLVTMAIDTMKCVLLVSDNHAESIDLENILIQNNYRVCSVRDGQYGIHAIRQTQNTHHPIELLVFDVLNRYYPGFMFLADLIKHTIQLPSIVVTDSKTSIEKIRRKTGFEVSTILPKKAASNELIVTVQSLI